MDAPICTDDLTFGRKIDPERVCKRVSTRGERHERHCQCAVPSRTYGLLSDGAMGYKMFPASRSDSEEPIFADYQRNRAEGAELRVRSSSPLRRKREDVRTT